MDTLCVPRHTLLIYLFEEGLHSYANAKWGGFSFEVLNFFYQLFTAYAYLPPDAHGFRGWFMPSTQNELFEGKAKVVLAPMSLSMAEPTARLIEWTPQVERAPSLARKAQSTAVLDLEPHSYSLCLPLHIGLFNFSWFVHNALNRFHGDMADQMQANLRLDEERVGFIR